MTYEEFINYIRENKEEMLGQGVKTKITKVLKNNNVEMDALSVVNSESHISPVIYLNTYYEEYKEGRGIEEISEEIFSLYEDHKMDLQFDADFFSDFDRIKNRIVYKLINTANNKKLLKDIPNIPFLDLSIVFYCMLDSQYLGSATALIHNVHMNMWGVKKEELYEIAKENTPQILKYELKDMNDLIEEILLSDIKNVVCENDGEYASKEQEDKANNLKDNLMKNIRAQKDKISMYVLTNIQRINGAASILYEGVIKKFADMVDKDIYILPSSVHEVILVPALEGMSEKYFTEMVKEVNVEELDQVDILSDHSYFYNRKEDIIEM